MQDEQTAHKVTDRRDGQSFVAMCGAEVYEAFPDRYTVEQVRGTATERGFRYSED